MINIPSSNDDPSYRYKMPRLVTKIEGRGNGIKTNFVNMAAVAAAIKSPPSYVTKFFGCELGAQSRWEDGTEKSIVNGAHDQPEMQKLLDKFLDKYVLCYKCKLPELNMAVTKGVINAQCAACGWSGNLDNLHKVATFMVSHPPDGKNVQNASKKESAPEVVVLSTAVGGFTSDSEEDGKKPEEGDKKKKEKKDKKDKKDKKEKKEKKEKKKEKSEGNPNKNTDSFSDDYPE